MCFSYSQSFSPLCFLGMASNANKPKFQMVTNDEVLESLWALDVYGRVYHYNKDVWVPVDKEMSHISAGINGVFGIGKDFKLYQREGITSSSKTGTAWKLLLSGGNQNEMKFYPLQKNLVASVNNVAISTMLHSTVGANSSGEIDTFCLIKLTLNFFIRPGMTKCFFFAVSPSP